MVILPSEIKLNIFSRLPVNSVLQCRQVCKSWRDLLDDNHFAHLHLRFQHGIITNQKHHQPLKINYRDISYRDGSITDFGMMSFLIFDRQRIYYAEYHEDEDGDFFFNTTRMNLNFPEDVNTFFVSSCNGLICLSTGSEPDGVISYVGEFPRRVTPLYICNPITREIVMVPGLYVHGKENENGVKLVHGFGYNPSTNEYKVVRICYHHSRGKYEHDDFLPGFVEVYTLGSGKAWRDIGKTDYCVVPNASDKTKNNCVNGALHWLMYKTGEIVAFDLADEKFHLIPKPPGLPSESQSFSRALGSRIFVMNGCLCLSYNYKYFDADLWMLKKNDKELDNQLEDQYYNKSWSWSKEFHIETAGSGVDKIFGLTKGGELLYVQFTGSMARYNPIRKTTSKRFDIEYFIDDHLFGPRMISHVHSFVSLKAAGEVNVETCMESTDDDDDKYFYDY